MWTRSAKNKDTGLFTVQVTDWNGKGFFTGEFADYQEAEQAGQQAERRMTLAMSMPAAVPTLEEILMSDDELMAELMA